MESREVRVYTDGACSGNPGVGAFAYRIEWPDGTIEEKAEATKQTTNNREELKGFTAALEAVGAKIDGQPGWRIVVFTDSQGVINWTTRRWKRNKNLDLYPKIDALMDDRVHFEYVKGHAGDPGNERVDELAVAAIKSAVFL